MANSEKATLEFFYDISCPFAYMGYLRVEALASRTNSNLIMTPVVLGGIYRETAAPQGAAGSASDIFNPTKKRITSQSLRRSLERNNVEVNWPSVHPKSPILALRMLYHVPIEERSALTKALYRAYWVEDLDITNKSVLLDVAKRSGIASQLSENVFDNIEAQNLLRKETAKVISLGAPGVPCFWIPQEKWMDSDGNSRQGRLYFGQDRMHFVEASLISLNQNLGYSQVPNLAKLQPRLSREPPTGQKRVEFWYDFSSPWAFLGWTQLARLKRQFGSEVEIIMRPILLGALFKVVGAPNLPMSVISEAKRKVMNQDMSDWVRHWNAINIQQGSHEKPIELRWPDQFPIRTPTVLRCTIVDPTLTPLIYRACWERNVNVSDEKVLAQFLSTAGYDAKTLLEKASSSKVKNILRANTDEAFKVGICGVPSYRIFEKVDDTWKMNGIEGGVIWGQDELPIVEDLVAGWKQKETQVGGYDSLQQKEVGRL